MKQYIKEKIKLLKQFGITLTYEQEEHIRSLKTEIAVDNFAHDLLKPAEFGARPFVGFKPGKFEQTF